MAWCNAVRFKSFILVQDLLAPNANAWHITGRLCTPADLYSNKFGFKLDMSSSSVNKERNPFVCYVRAWHVPTTIKIYQKCCLHRQSIPDPNSMQNLPSTRNCTDPCQWPIRFRSSHRSFHSPYWQFLRHTMPFCLSIYFSVVFSICVHSISVRWAVEETIRVRHHSVSSIHYPLEERTVFPHTSLWSNFHGSFRRNFLSLWLLPHPLELRRHDSQFRCPIPS